jgi:hypothetical protein
MRGFHPTFVLAAVAFLLAASPLRAQDADDDLLRGGSGPGEYQSPQSALPPTQPTSVPTPASAPTPTVLNQRPTHRARVIFANGLLEVRADNSSLLQILHDISRATSMTITGGVADSRIFGDYGPASPATVLATLIDGTGANMLLRQNPSTGAPIELVLTQRADGLTPASPNGSGFDDSPFPEDVTPPPAQPAPPIAVHQPAQPASAPFPIPVPQPANNPLGSPANQSPTASTLNTTQSVPIDTLPTPTTATPPPQGIVDAPNPPPPGSTSNANGTATPESIYQQLLQLKQATAATTTAQPSASPTTPAATPAPQPAKPQ